MPAPQNGGNSKLLIRTATAMLPPIATTAANAIDVDESRLSRFVGTAGALPSVISVSALELILKEA
jgi:hypothetical protein